MTRWSCALAAVLVLGVAACGGGEELTAEEIVERVADAVSEPGLVYHAIGDDGSEVWIDAENEKFRRTDGAARGELTSVGDGWERYTFDPGDNKVLVRDTSPQGPARPRIDHPMVLWIEALGVLAYGQEIELIGDTVADGRAVIALSARSPVTRNGEPTGATLVDRVELDPETYLPLSFERKEEAPPIATPSQDRVRIRYTTSELIPREDLPDGFFDPSVVEAQVSTPAESLRELEALGLTPYWLGESYESSGGRLGLPKGAVVTDTAARTAELHYALMIGTGTAGEDATPLLGSVVVRLAPDVGGFGPPELTEIGGALPESESEIAVRGVTGTLYTSLLTPDGVSCEAGGCPETERLYRRLTFLIGETAVQLEAFARAATSGVDLNGYNGEAGLVALGEAMITVGPEGTAP